MSYSNEMVAHIWAQREKESARSNNGNLSFAGPTLYSYSTPIGRFIDVGNQTAVLVTSRTYSMTTSSKHMPALRSAIGYGTENTFRVPIVSPIGENEHKVNLEHLVAAYSERVARVGRMRDYYGDYSTLATELSELAGKAERYAKLFKLRAPKFDPTGDATRIFEKRAEREAKRNTPEAIAKREKDKVEREERKARIEADRVGAWKRGDTNSLPHRGYGVPALLRVRKDRLETSQGANVPLADAIRVYRFAKLCKGRGEGWERNGRSLPVGHFNVDHVNGDGSFRAGCHLILWPEIEDAARQAGVEGLAPADTRD